MGTLLWQYFFQFSQPSGCVDCNILTELVPDCLMLLRSHLTSITFLCVMEQSTSGPPPSGENKATADYKGASTWPRHLTWPERWWWRTAGHTGEPSTTLQLKNPLSSRHPWTTEPNGICCSASTASEAHSLGCTRASCSKGCAKKGDCLEAQSLLHCTYVGFSLAFLFLLIHYHFTSPCCISSQLLLFFMLYKLVRQILRSCHLCWIVSVIH